MAAETNKPAAEFAVGDVVRVILSERNKTNGPEQSKTLFGTSKISGTITTSKKTAGRCQNDISLPISNL